MAQRTARMHRELRLLAQEPPHGISCSSVDDKVDQLEAKIIGSEDTPYHGGVFKLEIHIPERYPFQPPKVKFVTPIYHPNIDSAGRICLDTLKMPPKGAWKPSQNITTVLTSIQQLMVEPNPDDPLMADISDEFKYKHHQFSEKAKSWTKKYAMESSVSRTQKVLNSSSSSQIEDDKNNENDPQPDACQGGLKRTTPETLEERKQKILKPSYIIFNKTV